MVTITPFSRVLSFTASLFSFFVVSLFLVTSPVSAYYTNMSASVVLGQPNFVSNTANNGGVSASSMNGTLFTFSDGRRLYVSDYSNHRILIWNSIPTQSNTPADVVLGQPDLEGSTANNGGISASTLNRPSYAYTDGTRFVVSDTLNRRVLIWNSIPTRNQQPADVVVGQPDFATSSSGTSAVKMNLPFGVILYNGKLITMEMGAGGNNRVLIFNSIPTTNGASADIVVGQPDFSTISNGTTSSKFTNPRGMGIVNDKFIVCDAGNNRCLVFNQLPISSGTAADYVIGQTDFVSSGSDSGGVSCSSLNSPNAVTPLTNGRFLIGDNHRLLIFNKVPSANHVSADIVIGQPNCSSRVDNYGGVSASSISGNNRGGTEIGKNLIIADSGNSRILIFNNALSTPTLTVGFPESLGSGKMKLSGGVVLGNRGTYSLQNVQVSVNGSGFAQATTIGSGTDGGNNNTNYVFSHEFEPWTQNNGSRDQWIADTSGMLSSQGLTMNVKATSLNAEEDNLFLFTPFKLNSVSTGVLPTISFSVNSSQWDRIKDSLSSYEVHVKKNLTTAEKKKGVKEYNWNTYLEGVPVDSTANQNPSISTTFDKTSGTITVRSKSKTLPSGTYTVQVLAKDKWGHTTNQTNEMTYTSTGGSLVSTKPSLPVTTEWFPLQVNKISGINTGVISNFNPSIKSSYLSTTSTPTFEGIAFNNTTVTIQVTDTKSGKSKIYTTTPVNSVFKITPTLFSSSLVDIWVTDGNGRYSELPSLSVNF